MKILMVCLGNICRSPLAEGVMRHLINEQNLGWEVASAGTGDWHVGNPPDKRGTAVAKEFGYDISAQRGRHFTSNLFDEFDHILVMDKNNYKDVLKLAKNDEQRNKVQFFLADRGEVMDPYRHSHLFEPVFKEVEARCKKLIERFKKEVH
ncbi:MAG: low molecular weight protein-tyrosine-phosphatase [Bacteroidota bacterium]|uniref:protein-tyrosine-phosphatase n=1 Tax=Pedobacter cryotolerans TaxID=2571270 RepID=A0A4U1CB55_9SPHI|nr:low molecular weight protein-tyrosine-phosphatase [Pedobacter cryotolerans]TKC03276.1 low molecular weight phosphotyrosine protein phosphatase [Pedobacter cryotolerans]